MTRRREPTRRSAITGLGALLLAAEAVRAGAQTPADGAVQRDIALRIARDFAIPRYRALAAAAAEQASAWKAYGAKPSEAGLRALKTSYAATADAWSGIEALRSGPIAEDNRYERMAHWPERRNAVSRAIAGLLGGTEAFTPERVGRASVAGQGLTALERLLYGEAEGGEASAGRELAAGAGARRRALGLAVADGLARVTADVAAAWEGPELSRLGSAGPDDAREALTRFATDGLAALELIQDAKINAVLGKSPDEVRPLLAEGWRSGRSLRAIRINLEAEEAFVRAALAHDPDRLQDVVAGFATVRSLADGLAGGTAPIGALAADRSGRMRLVLLRDAVGSAREVAGPALSDALAITIGFNSQDGD